MAFTVRPSDDEELLLAEVKKITKTNAATKAIFKGLELLIQTRNELNQTKKQLYDTQVKLSQSEKIVNVAKQLNKMLSED